VKIKSLTKILPNFVHDNILHPMSMPPGSLSRGRGLAAVFVFAAFLWTITLSVSPQLHARIHADANRVEHACAVTFIAAGQYNHSHAPITVSGGVNDAPLGIVPEVSAPWTKSAFLSASTFERAPPAVV
jgi:hypothetical protein